MNWISVAERLPERDDEVLFVADNFDHKGNLVGKKVCMGHLGNDLWWNDVDQDSDNTSAIETGVTHWMYLPEPPK